MANMSSGEPTVDVEEIVRCAACDRELHPHFADNKWRGVVFCPGGGCSTPFLRGMDYERAMQATLEAAQAREADKGGG